MKRIFSLILLLLISISVYSRNTIKFLGIPVDGTKKEMQWKLEKKGFVYDKYTNEFYGEFNGEQVVIAIQTVNNKVYRLIIEDRFGCDENSIKDRYNKLYNQFINNGKYGVMKDGLPIDEETDISYEMTLNEENFQVGFYLLDEKINGMVWYYIERESSLYHIVMFYENLDNEAKGEDL